MLSMAVSVSDSFREIVPVHFNVRRLLPMFLYGCRRVSLWSGLRSESCVLRQGGAAAGLATMIIPLLILDSFIMITPGVAGDQGAVVPAW